MPGSWRYYALLAVIGIFLLGPLGGIAAAYMNFSLGFFIGGQTLAGILGSLVTLGYGADGKHGANYMQTTAASVAGMAAMAVVIQAFVWLGLPLPPAWQIVVYLTCIGMFGVGVGMLYTPLLVDRMRLTYPSGLAVANILRALTDPRLLRRSVATLGGGIATGITAGIAGTRLAWLGTIEFSASTFGAGMIVGARIGVAALTGGLISLAAQPYFVSIGWLAPTDPFRKITFLIALGMILGAAILDVSLILRQAWQRLRGAAEPQVKQEAWQRIDTGRVLLWVAFWGVAVVVAGTSFFGTPVLYLLFALGLVFIFALVNGISVGISDSNPISSAFVVTVVLLAAIGLREPAVGMIAATVLLVSTSVACDMQQDRSTGWRLGTNRTIQFRFQAGGIAIGAILSVVLAQLFMAAYPVLKLDQTVLPADQQPAEWTAAMTYKFVGALRGLIDDKPYQRTAIWLGISIGLTVAVLRKLIKDNERYKHWVAGSRSGFATDFMVDSVLLPSPYASSFGGFVNLATSSWFAAGGVVSSAINTLSAKRRRAQKDDGVPEDMNATSLVGGGLIAGDALAALSLGVAGLLRTVSGR